MATYDRELEIVYGSLTIGGAANPYYLPTEDWAYSVDRETSFGIFSFKVWVTGDGSRSTFLTKRAAFIAAMDLRAQNFTATLYDRRADPVTSTDIVGWNHAGRTGMNATAKAEEIKELEVASLWQVSIRVLVGQASKIDGSISWQREPAGFRVVTFRFRYHGSSGSTALAKYGSDFATDVAAAKSALGISEWEDIGEPDVRFDDLLSSVMIMAQYREVDVRQSVSTTNHPAIVHPTLKIVFSAPAPGDSGNAERFIEGVVTYSSAIKFSVQPSLKTAWSSIVLPLIEAEIKAHFYTFSAFAWVDLRPGLDKYKHRIEVDGARFVAVAGSATISMTRTTMTNVNPGVTPVPVWDGASAHAKHIFDGAAEWVETTIVESRVLAGSGGSLINHGNSAGGGPQQHSMNSFSGGPSDIFLGGQATPHSMNSFSGFPSDPFAAGGGGGSLRGGGGGISNPWKKPALPVPIRFRGQPSRKKIGRVPNQIEVIDDIQAIVVLWYDEPSPSPTRPDDVDPGEPIRNDSLATQPSFNYSGHHDVYEFGPEQGA